MSNTETLVIPSPSSSSDVSSPLNANGTTHAKLRVVSRHISPYDSVDDDSSDDDSSDRDSSDGDSLIHDTQDPRDLILARNPIVIPRPPLYSSRDDGSALPLSGYHLRKSCRNFINLRTTWLDQDDSGDYDPNRLFSEPKTVPSSKRERIVRWEEDDIGSPLPKKPKIYTWRWGRKEGLSLPIVIKLRSEGGLALLTVLKEMSKYPDNWPEKEPKGKGEQPNFTEILLNSIQPQRLRQRHRNGVSSGFLQEQELNLPNLADVTLGHPAARGCKNCFDINIPCSLLVEGEKYPCRECKQDDMDCELILQPLKKRPCENCRRQKIVCSYRTTEDHSQPCQDCFRLGHKCVAGPLTGRTRTGPSLDCDFKQFIPTPERPYKSCAACRKMKKRCSLESDPGYHNCTQCEIQGLKCTFEAVLKSDRKTSIKQQAENTGILQDLSAPAEIGTPQDIPAHAGLNTISIKTRLAHPIYFNYDPPADGTQPCHWCDDLAYGIIGLPETHVRVTDYQDGRGYVEVSEGHAASGYPPSRMCRLCTSAVMLILGCTAHGLIPITGVSSAASDLNAVMQSMEPGRAGDAPFEWCRVCRRPAFYQCLNPLSVEMNLPGIEELGCGLKLCEWCASDLMNEHDGKLTECIAALEQDDSDPFHSKLRADASLLRSDGELMRLFAE